MRNKKESFLKGVFVLLLSQIFIKVIGLCYKIYLTNKEGFGDIGIGIYSSGFQIYALLLTFSSTGVPNAIAKLVSERMAVNDVKGANTIFKISFIVFAIIGATGSYFLFIFSKIIAEKCLLIPEARLSLVALSPAVFFVSISSVIRGYFNGMQIFSITAKSQSLEQIFKTICTIIFVEVLILIGKNNIIIMAAGANLATTVATMCSFIYIFIGFKIKKIQYKNEIKYYNNDGKLGIRDTLKKIVTVAFPISLSSLIASFNKNIDSFTVVRFLKYNFTEAESKTQYGILSGKIDSLCAIAFSLNIAFVTTLVPNISKCMAIGDMESVRKKSKYFILISFLIALPITFIMYTFSSEILEILFPNASNGAIYLKYSSFSIIFMLLAQTTSAILQGIGKNYICPIAFGIGMIVKFLCNIILIPYKNIGIFGAIIGNIACNVVAFLICFSILKKYIYIRLDFVSMFIKPVICCIFMICLAKILYINLLCILLEKVAMILSIAISVLFYFLLINIFKILLYKQN